MIMNDLHNKWMKVAIKQALIALKNNEIPIGAIVVKDNKVIGHGYNSIETYKKATAHAEILAIESASIFLNNWRLVNCDLYTTLEPCAMCSGAIIKSRIKNIFFGAYSKEGCVSSLYNLCNDNRFNHVSGIKGGLLEKDCNKLLCNFFENKA
mgnify:CR=1 FL=1